MNPEYNKHFKSQRPDGRLTSSLAAQMEINSVGVSALSHKCVLFIYKRMYDLRAFLLGQIDIILFVLHIDTSAIFIVTA